MPLAVPNHGVPFAGLEETNGLTAAAVNRILSDGKSDFDNSVDQIFAQISAPLNFWQRNYSASIFRESLNFAPTNEMHALEVKAKFYMEIAVLQRLKRHFSMRRDTTFLSDGAWPTNDLIGGALPINQTGFWTSVFHLETSVEQLFNADGNELFQSWNVGHPFTEEVIQHMLSERYELAMGITDFMQQSVDNFDDPRWPLRIQYKDGNFQTVEYWTGLSIDPQDDFAIQATTDLQAQINGNQARKSRMLFPDQKINPTQGKTKFTWGGTDLGSLEIAWDAGPDDQLNQYGALLGLTVREISRLRLMLDEAKTATWWRDFRSKNPAGFTLFVIGDFFLGFKEMYEMTVGKTLENGVKLTGPERVMAFGMTILNVVPGATVLKGGRILAGAARETAGAIKGAAQNIAAHHSESTVNQALNVLTRSSDAEAQTVLGTAEDIARRGGDQVQRLGIAGLSKATKVIDGALDDATKLQIEHGVGAMTDSVVIEKGVGAPSAPYADTSNAVGPRALNRVVDARAAPSSARKAIQVIDAANEFERDLVRQGKGHLIEELRRIACFPAGTLVRMANGESSPIESIRAGDHVLSRSASPPRRRQLAG